MTKNKIIAISITVLIAGVVIYWLNSSPEVYLIEHYPAAILEDLNLDVQGLLEKHKYPYEQHFTTTADGYILQLHRMPRASAKPVLVMHGLGDTSATWLFTGPSIALGYHLYDEGYDVWMGNVRGNRFSRNHTMLSPEQAEFWNFSWHEMGIYDLPAMIDYVLLQTGFSKLSYVGHSQGSTMFFVMATMRPEYQQKVSAMSALTPAVFMQNMKLPLSQLFSFASGILSKFCTEAFPYRTFFMSYCFRSDFTVKACRQMLHVLLGRHENMVHEHQLPLVIGYFPAGCSFKQIEHYFQVYRTGRFRGFDYGTAAANTEHHGTIEPADYQLSSIKTPIGVYYCRNDHLTSVEDIQHLITLLPNVVNDVVVPHADWNHYSITWNANARAEVHRLIVSKMREYE